MNKHPHIYSPFATDGVMPLQDRHKPEVRKYLSGPSLRSFFKLANEWSLSVADQCALLGHIPRSTYHKWKSGNIGILSYDQLERLSLIFGIYKALKLLFVDQSTRLDWMNGPNKNPIFCDKSPIMKMIDGGIEDFYQIRRYLDSWRGGEC